MVREVMSLRVNRTSKLKLDLLQKLTGKKKYKLLEEAISLLVQKYKELGYEIPDNIVEHSEDIIEKITKEFEKANEKEKESIVHRKIINLAKYLLYRAYDLFSSYNSWPIICSDPGALWNQEWKRIEKQLLRFCVQANDLWTFNTIRTLFYTPLSYINDREDFKSILEEYYYRKLIQEVDDSTSYEEFKEKLRQTLNMLKEYEKSFPRIF